MRLDHTQQGFSLIELLTVIAIISILAAMTAVIVPRARERAKVASVENDFHQIHTALAQYAVEHGGYPPAYGYRTQVSRSVSGLPDYRRFHLNSYATLLNFAGAGELYDQFSRSYNTNRHGNDTIEPLEFSPIFWNRRTDTPTSLTRFTFTGRETVEELEDIRRYNPPIDESGSLLQADTLDNQDLVTRRDSARPYVYVPVNLRQYEMVRRFYEVTKKKNEGIEDGLAKSSLRTLKRLRFPPPRYDAYVLIGVGPSMETSGILSPPNQAALENFLDGISRQDWYHVLGLRTYYLATRDLNENYNLDFDFRARTRQREGRAEFDRESNLVRQGTIEPKDRIWVLPDGSNASGPMIFRQEG